MMVAPSGFWLSGSAGEEEFEQDLMNACLVQIGTKATVDALLDRAGMFAFSSDDKRFWRSNGSALINMGVMEFGVDASKPTASAANNGRVYFATDTLTLYVVDNATQYLVSDQNVVVDHVALGDPHTQYQKESEKNAANGYAGLDAGGLVLQSDLPDHAARHPTGAADEIDGDKLDIDFTPTVYVPSTAPAEADDLDNLTSHLAGIDDSLAEFIAQRVAVKTASEVVTTDTVLQNDDDLVFSIGANERWLVRVTLFMNAPAAGNFKWAWSIPSGADGLQNAIFWAGTSPSNGTLEGIIPASSLTVQSVTYGNTVRAAIIEVEVETAGTPGSVQFQWAQNSSSGSTTLNEGSSLIATKMA